MKMEHVQGYESVRTGETTRVVDTHCRLFWGLYKLFGRCKAVLNGVFDLLDGLRWMIS